MNYNTIQRFLYGVIVIIVWGNLNPVIATQSFDGQDSDISCTGLASSIAGNIIAQKLAKSIARNCNALRQHLLDEQLYTIYMNALRNCRQRCNQQEEANEDADRAIFLRLQRTLMQQYPAAQNPDTVFAQNVRDFIIESDDILSGAIANYASQCQFTKEQLMPDSAIERETQISKTCTQEDTNDNTADGGTDSWLGKAYTPASETASTAFTEYKEIYGSDAY
ncbi:hypothetical protein M1466_03915 [Candidatus Dependentiae bacterium]|nr:hypothetical protein [Candidatus Dependentiae bacterium]